MNSDPLAAMLQALEKREAPPRQPRSTANSNHPFKSEYQRPLRETNPAKWSPPAYRDREAERVVGRLSKKERKS